MLLTQRCSLRNSPGYAYEGLTIPLRLVCVRIRRTCIDSRLRFNYRSRRACRRISRPAVSLQAAGYLRYGFAGTAPPQPHQKIFCVWFAAAAASADAGEPQGDSPLCAISWAVCYTPIAEKGRRFRRLFMTALHGVKRFPAYDLYERGVWWSAGDR